MRALPSWQVPFLGLSRFPRDLTLFEINTFFTFDERELEAIRTRRRDTLRLASGVHLGFLKMTGTTLDALDRIPLFVLARVAGQLGVPSMDIATVRSLYRRRRRTLFEHQRWAMETLGVEPFTEHRERALSRAFAPSVTSVSDTSAVVLELMRWLYTRGIRIPATRRVRSVATRVVRRAEGALAGTVLAEIPYEVRQQWDERLFASRTGTSTTYLEWLGTPPSRRATGALSTALEKRAFLLLELMVPQYRLSNVRLDNLAEFSKRCRNRKPSRARRLQEPIRALEIVCSLQHAWLEINDTVLSLADGLTTDLRRRARERGSRGTATEFASMRALLGRVRAIAEDTHRTDRDVREFVLNEISRDSTLGTSRAWQHREALIADRRRVRYLLESMTTPRLTTVSGTALEVILDVVGRRRPRYRHPLTVEAVAAMPKRWQAHLVGRDTAATHAVFDAAALVTLQRALKNGSVWAAESLSHVNRDALLIDGVTWGSERIARYRELNLPINCDSWLRQRLEHLESGLEGVRLAVEAGTLPIDERGVVLQRPGAEPTDRSFERARKQLVGSIDAVQFSEIIVDIDQSVRFSWQLLQRAPRNRQELLAVYGAVLVHGTARSVSDVSLMMPSVRAGDISDALSLLEQRDVLRSANDTVVALMFREPITRHWGSGTAVSSDGMSLDVSRSLWNARTDPRRRTYGMGQYQHVLDRWGIVYNQPLVLGSRQAGAAIEGAVRQRLVPAIDRVAVDTHGYTDVAMALARLLGFDLCPRLKGMNDRRLQVPIGFAVADTVASITRSTVVLSAIESEWDALVRLAASIKSGTVTATVALGRLGSTSTGDPLYRAAKMLGRLERSIFLCDVMTNPDFRRALHRDLSHGEAVHSLQRAIYQGALRAGRGRRAEEMAAISGSLTLLTNIVMAWNTRWLQRCLDEAYKGEGVASIQHITRMAPIHHQHINLNGQFRFDVAEQDARLFKPSGTFEG